MRKALLLLFIVLATTLSLPACKPNATSTQPDAAKAPETKPARVLVLSTTKSDCAADGYLWLAMMYASTAENLAKKPELMEGSALASGKEMAVTEETIVEPPKGTDKPQQKNDPKNFDFVVSHHTEYNENSKKSFDAPLQISVKETWKAAKVSDPSISKTWNFSYLLSGGADISKYDQTAEEQIQKTIIPVRSPHLKEIAAFVEANRAK